MSSSRGKKVHYGHGTKGEKSHRHYNSRDSGVGSSSASNQAFLDQRLHVTALQEALDAANDEIRQLQEGNAKLSSSLAKSNMENRALREERIELLTKVDELKKDLKDERKANEKFRRESLPRTGGTAPAPKERRTMPPRREHADPRH